MASEQICSLDVVESPRAMTIFQLPQPRRMGDHEVFRRNSFRGRVATVHTSVAIKGRAGRTLAAPWRCTRFRRVHRIFPIPSAPPRGRSGYLAEIRGELHQDDGGRVPGSVRQFWRVRRMGCTRGDRASRRGATDRDFRLDSLVGGYCEQEVRRRFEALFLLRRQAPLSR